VPELDQISGAVDNLDEIGWPVAHVAVMTGSLRTLSTLLSQDNARFCSR